jgi:serine/threonine-protein kinase
MSSDSGQTTAVRTIGRYRAFDELGRGAMGVVYRGFDPVIGRTVALKTLILDTGDAQAREFRDRLYREAAAAGALSHPGIVTIFDIIEDGSITAVAMEFIEGRSLASIIAERAPLPLDTAMGIFDQICRALDYAGSAGIVHRDIKPANILMTPDGRAKITDFGVARLALSTMTQAGTVLGSPSYMSPEQVRGLPLDGRSDLFSAAVVFYEMITRERPFAGTDVATTMYRIAHEPPTPPGQFNAAIGPDLTSLLERALAKNPDTRFRTGAEMVNEFRRVLNLSATSPGTARVAYAATELIPPGTLPPAFGVPTQHMPSARTETQPSPLPAAPLDLTVASGPVTAPPVPMNAPPLPAPAPVAHTAHVVLPSPEAIVAAATNPSNVLAPLPGDGPAARTPTGSSPALAPVPGTDPAPAAGVTTTKAAPPRLVIVGGAAVLLVAVVGIFLATRGGGDTSATPEAEAPLEAPATTAAPPPAATVPDTPPPTVAVPPPAAPPPAAPVRSPSASRRPATPPASTARTGAAPAPAASSAGNGGKTIGPFEIDKVDERPSVRRQVPAAYPADALQRRVEDVVILRVLVTTSGTAGDVQVLRGSKKDVAFDAAAITAVRQWTFTPAKKAGRAVECWFNVGVPFQLRR